MLEVENDLREVFVAQDRLGLLEITLDYQIEGAVLLFLVEKFLCVVSLEYFFCKTVPNVEDCGVDTVRHAEG